MRSIVTEKNGRTVLQRRTTAGRMRLAAVVVAVAGIGMASFGVFSASATSTVAVPPDTTFPNVTTIPPTTITLPDPTTTTVTTTAPAAAVLTVSTNQAGVGGSVTISGDGFAPGASLVAELHSTPVRLAAFKAGADGTFSTTVTIPADTTPGLHEIVVVGAGLDGIRTITADITVVAALAAVATTPTPVRAAPNYTG